MNNRWLALAGITAFGITLAVVVGSRMESTGALALALGVGVGVVAGVAIGLLVALPQGGASRSPGAGAPDDQQSIVLPPDQAATLIKLLTSRRQASPEDFPMVADRERSISSVGGANIDFSDEE
jgi:hypothetical protein